jgi:hypothetical protein
MGEDYTGAAALESLDFIDHCLKRGEIVCRDLAFSARRTGKS